MSILSAIIAVIIFANPFLSVLDIFPDVIGCILIWFALRRAEFFSPTLEEARRLWLKLALITAGDAVASYFLFSSKDQTLILLSVSVFRVAEAIFMYLAAKSTFDGVVYLGTKFDGEGIYMHDSERRAENLRQREQAKLDKLDAMLERERERYDRETETAADDEHRHRATERYKHAVALISADAGRVKKKRDIVTRLTRSTLVFIIIRTCACVLPEFTSLSSFEYSGDVTSGAGFNIANFRGLFIVLGAFAAFIAAVVWAVHMLRYIHSIKRDRVFCREIVESFRELTSGQETRLTCRRLVTALIFLAIGFVLTLDLYIDYVNYVPDYVSALFFLMFFIILYRDLKLVKVGIILSAVVCAASAAQTLLISNFINRFDDFTRTYNSAEARSAHIVCCVSAVVAEAAMIALAFVIFRTLKEIIDKHTGVAVDEGVITSDSISAREMLAHENKRSFDLSVVSSVMSVVWMICIGINKQVVVKNEFTERVDYVPTFTSVSIVTVFVTLACIIYVVKYISDLKDEIKEKYRYI